MCLIDIASPEEAKLKEAKLWFYLETFVGAVSCISLFDNLPETYRS